ncbi:MAG: hypothetical protein ACRDRJ_08665 [Streptosporangiaceae bacterium]
MNGAVNRDYDDILRRALHAAAESVEPSADGLERIRERLGYPPLLSFSSIAGWYSVAAVRFTGWAVPAFGTACEIFWALVDRFRPLDTPPGHAKPGLRWLRPVTATALAIFVVAGAAFAAKVIPGAINATPTGASGPGNGVPGSGGASGQGAVHGSSPFQATPGSSGYTGTPSPTGSVASKCHLASSSASPTTVPTSGTPSSSSPISTSTSPGPMSTSPQPTTTSPSPATSDTSPGEPGSGATGTPGAEASSPDSTDPGSSGSVSPGAPGSSTTTPAPGDTAAGQTPGAIGSSTGPCPSSSPTSKSTRKSTRKVVQRMLGLGRPDLVITSSGRAGRYTLPSGRNGESY